MNQEEIIQWLLKGDVSIQYQAYCDLLGIERKDLQDRIKTQFPAYNPLGPRRTS
jgi:hypothetical protein